ncbi:hypothetical protein MUK42_03493 [Musa troglodytarum]|uniref:Uncharacterized protein n=1 Tax=Musa troglodytarum TaxID=320322 RepID=A0A9E7GSY4_9LILI|nr:hypothetical protein MUK42_03493 [Musa troglodytarum]
MKWAAREILVEEDRSLLQIKPVGFFRFEWFNPTGTSGSNLCNFEKPSSRRRALNRNNWSKTSREGKCSTRTMEFETAENDGHLRERSSRKKRKRKESKTWMTTEEKKPTVNIAVAGSIIDNAQSLELATLLAGQVARAATIFRIDEVVVFDNRASSDVDTVVRTGHDGDESESGAEFLTMILRDLLLLGAKASSNTKHIANGQCNGGYDHIIGTSEHGLVDKSAEGRGRVARRQRRLLVVEVERRLVQFQTCMDQGKVGVVEYLVHNRPERMSKIKE